MILGVDLNVTIEDDAGSTEDGSYTFGTPTDVSCAIRSFSTPNTAVVVDTTTRCATMVQDKGIRSDRKVDMVIDLPDTGTPYFGTVVNKIWQIVVKWNSSSTAETLVCALRSNNISSDADGRAIQTVSFRVLSVS